MKRILCLIIVCTVFVLSGCAVKPKVRVQQIDESVRQPTHTIDVFIDRSEISREYRRVALIYGDDNWLIEKEKMSVDDLIDLMIAETKELGADGLILDDIDEVQNRFLPSRYYSTPTRLSARGKKSTKIILQGIAIIYTD